MKKIFKLLATTLAFLFPTDRGFGALNLITDGNFQQAGTSQGIPSYSIFNISNIQSGSNPIVGWQTTAPDQKMEVWASGFLGVPAATGSSYFAEMNANVNATLFQVVQLGIADPVGFSLAHRGRFGIDTMDLQIYDIGASTSWAVGQGTLTYSQRIATGSTDWGYYGNNNIFTPTAGNYYAFTFVSVAAAGGYDGAGNFLDNIEFGYGIGPTGVPEPGQIAASLVLLAGIGGYVAMKRRRAVKQAA